MDGLAQSDDSLVDAGICYVWERYGLPVEYARWVRIVGTQVHHNIW